MHGRKQRGAKFRESYARREKQIEGESMETSEKKGGGSASKTGIMHRHGRDQ